LPALANLAAQFSALALDVPTPRAVSRGTSDLLHTDTYPDGRVEGRGQRYKIIAAPSHRQPSTTHPRHQEPVVTTDEIESPALHTMTNQAAHLASRRHVGRTWLAAGGMLAADRAHA